MDIKQLSGRNLSGNIQDKNGVQLETKTSGSNKESESTAADNDSVIISSQAQKINQIVSSLSSVPEVNTTKVTEIRDALANGQFKINSQSTAEKLLNLEKSIR